MWIVMPIKTYIYVNIYQLCSSKDPKENKSCYWVIGYYSDRYDYVIWKDCCDLSLGLEDHSVLRAQCA